MKQQKHQVPCRQGTLRCGASRLIDERCVINANNGTTTDKRPFFRRVLAMQIVGQTIRERTALVDRDVGFANGTAELRRGVVGMDHAVSVLRRKATCVKRAGQWPIQALQRVSCWAK